ncbi:Type IV fimbrial biogenesis protein FimT [hydrothermal vent metagenome]|uniref:Type IV fimbrial biogenesis protein FimT n=1 Tax=hydrothermal vent metagenome TaxID=652676 RepID=A0A3B1BDP6_9ZZZZ
MRKTLSNHGFTLVELMVTLVVITILLTTAIPSFQDVIRDNRTTTHTNNLITALNLARSEAIERGLQVTIRRKGSTSQNWDGGWDVFADLDADGVLDDDGDTTLCESGEGEDCLIRTYDALANGYTLRTGANFADWVAYLPNGYSQGSSGTADGLFRLCDNESGATGAELIARSRAIAITISGRPRTQTGTASCP